MRVEKQTYYWSLAKNVGVVKEVFVEPPQNGLPEFGETTVLLSTNRVYDDKDTDEDDDCGCDVGIDDGALNYADGIVSLSEQDVDAGWSSRISFVRKYNSGNTNDSDEFGLGWSHNYSARLEFTALEDASSGTSEIRLVRPGGQKITFNRVAGAWKGNATVSGTLSTTADATGVITSVKYTNPMGDAELYDGSGKLLSVLYSKGGTVNLTYESSGANRLQSAADNFGHQISFSYDGNNRVKAITYGQGRSTGYSYDDKGRLASVTRPDGKVRTYNYNETDTPPADANAAAKLDFAITSIIDENGTKYADWSYDDSGRVTSSEYAGGVKRVLIEYGSDNTRTVTDGLNRTRSYSFERILGKTRTSALSAPCDVCPQGQFASRTYDANGNVMTATDFNGIVTSYSYDLTRNLEIKRVEAYGTPKARTISTQWDATRSLPVRVAAPKRLTTFTYYTNGNLQKKTVQATLDENGSQGLNPTLTDTPRSWTYTYNNSGQILTITGPRTDVSDVTTYSYDSTTGNLTSIKDPLGRITTYSFYDFDGHVGKIVMPNGVINEFTYYPRGWLATKKVSAGGAVRLTTYAYDNIGQVTKVTFPDTTSVQYTYDNAHRLTDISDSAGNKIHYVLDNMGNRVSESISDSSGTLAARMTRVFNDLNRLDSVTRSFQ
jgi:YD repeat-containing protein